MYAVSDGTMIGETIGNYEVVARLGKGGMGEVWLAEHVTVRTRVAIKLLDPGISGDPQQRDRFFHQALATGRVQHPGVGKIFDVGVTDGRAFLVMEYLEGETLRRRLRTAPPSLRRAAELGQQIANVLVATHAAGVIHRDLKPENIMLVRDPGVAGGERARLVDFGIAKVVDVALTSTSAETMGTAAYMPPEQWRDVAKVDARSDVYALGCVVFEMVCGRPPFTATSFGEACTQHLTDPPPGLHSLVPAAPDALAQLVARMLAKDPASRPSMAEVEHDLAAIAGSTPPPTASPPAEPIGATQVTAATGPAPATPHPPATPAALATTRRRTPIVVAGLATVVVGAGIAVGLGIRGGASHPPADASVDAVVDAHAVVRVAPRDAGTADIHTITATSDEPNEREFLTGTHLPERIAGDDPALYAPVPIRVCFVATTGVVERVAVDATRLRDDPRIRPVIIETVLGWRFDPYPSKRRLVCRALALPATVTRAKFDADHPAP